MHAWSGRTTHGETRSAAEPLQTRALHSRREIARHAESHAAMRLCVILIASVAVLCLLLLLPPRCCSALPPRLQSAYIGAIAVADLVKTTLGPKGMDKILQSMGGPGTGRGVSFTNDGATILKSIPIDNPAAKIIVDTSKTQDIEVGDGTTSVAVLSGELLREAEKLTLQKIHPQIIIRGYRKAVTVARAALLAMSQDHSADPVAFRRDLINIAETTLSSKILSSNKQQFAELAVDAILRLKGNTDLSCIQIIKKVGGSIQDSYLESGFILDKKIGVGQPKRIENANILVANTALDTDKVKNKKKKQHAHTHTKASKRNAHTQIQKLQATLPPLHLSQEAACSCTHPAACIISPFSLSLHCSAPSLSPPLPLSVFLFLDQDFRCPCARRRC